MSTSQQPDTEAAAGHESQVPKGGDSVDCLVGHDWRPIETAPKDGTEIELLIRHRNYWLLHPRKDAAGWEEAVRGKWIDHNGGGWTWHGLCGWPEKWRPLPNSDYPTNR